MWFEEWFSSKLYLDLYSHRNDEDARKIINLMQRSISVNTGCKILDIACGAGRHSLELARRGFDVTGFDLSKFLIGEAKKSLRNSPEKSLRVKFLIKDMRHFNFKNSFDIAMNIFSSFGYFENDEENFNVIRNVSNSLKSGGYFIFDFLNKQYLEKNLVPFSQNKYGDMIIIQNRKIEGDFVIKDIKISKKNKEMHFQEILKLYSVKKFKNIFNSYSLRVHFIFGDYFGNKFNDNKSQRLIIIAKKN